MSQSFRRTVIEAEKERTERFTWCPAGRGGWRYTERYDRFQRPVNKVRSFPQGSTTTNMYALSS